MFAMRLRTIRGQLVLWYLSVLAILLLGLGIFQSLTLSEYLRSTTSASMRQAGYAELRVLGPCFIRSSTDLEASAQVLARLLGSHDTAVKIVTASGQALADHSFGNPGSSHALRLSAATIRRLIASTSLPGTRPRAAVPQQTCQPLHPSAPPRHPGVQSTTHPTVSQGDLLLVAIPLGPYNHPVGYAILGRSFADASATIRRTEVVFVLGALIALLLAAVIALPLINRALRPLRQIATTAEAIAGGDLEQRANLGLSPDEIGRLGDAFDTMVDRLHAAVRAANESEERMRRFLADASHELRTPLTVVRGMSEVLLRQGQGVHPEFEEALQAMHEESVRLSGLVDDLLTLSRLDSGQSLSPEVIRLRPFLQEFMDRYGSAWPNRQIDLDLHDLDGGATFVDPQALRRILTNLVDNAARYSTPGKDITLAGRVNGTDVTVAVRDEGPGLSPQDAERVFERFYRGTKSRSRDSGGSGLGLAIVRALAQQSGGRVQIDTGPNQGTIVAVTLPRVQTENG